jgi:recombination protein RecT
MNPEQPQELDKPTVAEQASEQLAKRPGTVKDILRGAEFKAALREVLPTIMRPDRFVRIALTTMMRIPELAECSRPSLFRCLLDLSSYGLEPDGRRAHLIPFKNNKYCQCGHLMDEHKGQQCSKCDCSQRKTLVECTLIVDYKGLAELVRRSGDVSYIHADVVYENDEWSYAYGTEAHLRHKPNAKDRGGEKVAAYSYVRLKDGSEDFIVMNMAEVEKIRKRSKAADSGPWKTDFDEMAKKTAFRRHSKWLPLSPDVRDAVEREDTEAVDATGTWNDLLGEADASKPSRARDRILSQPSYAHDAGAADPQAEEPPK